MYDDKKNQEKLKKKKNMLKKDIYFILYIFLEMEKQSWEREVWR